ncbi:MAG: chaperonin GroEL [Candidatus Brocadiia bacterium]
MAKQLTYSDSARAKLYSGVRKTADAVRVTLGPAGRNVILQRGADKPQATADGVSVIKDIELEDKFENLACQLIREVSSHTNDTCGDGTTTSAILTEAIFAEGMRYVTAGSNPMAIKRGIEKAVVIVRDHLKDISKPCDTLAKLTQVATISANNDVEIGELVAKAVQKVGAKGAISTKEGKSINTTLEFVDGMNFDKGYLSPYFITNREKQKAVIDEPLILFYDKKISTVQELLPILEKTAGSSPLLIIAEDIENEVLSLLVINALRGVLRLCAVKAPAFGDRRKAMLEDMAVLTGGTVITEEKGMKLENATLEMLGRATKVEVEKENTVIIGGKGSREAIEARIAQIRSAIEQTKSNYDREKLEERLAKLTGGVAEISVGAATEMELKHRKDIVEDAVNAAKAAAEEGSVIGGGLALYRATPKLAALKLEGDEQWGVKAVMNALSVPVSIIASNAGEDGSAIVSELSEMGPEMGFDARAHEFVNLRERGILDPTKVSRTVLEYSASMAAMMITAECLIAPLDVEEGKEPKSAGENIVI